ncbi:MAG: RNA 2',3'-cyclic phosphodiesterase [Verrucomicrobia bacterium]|nr:RNA 2',3'-cyclic phosphodiesterase [Verrucomicrobiota bacterium]
MSLESKVLRLFVAIALPEEVKVALGGVQGELKEVLPLKSTAWTKPENFHLTLRFLGRVELGRVSELERHLRENLAQFGELELICERLGCFPGPRLPRVVWTWVHDPGERLALLHRSVSEAVGGFGEKPGQERFVGHVTIARPKQTTRTEAERLARFIESAGNRRFGGWNCSEVELIQSELSAGGSRYTRLAKFRLSQQPPATRT